jgi:hypothetical protein
MGFEKKIPSSAAELKTNLELISKNVGHVKSVDIWEPKLEDTGTNPRLRIDLDRAANFTGHPDIYMPLKRGKGEQARALLERLMSQVKSGGFPSDGDINSLFDMIDQQGS